MKASSGARCERADRVEAEGVSRGSAEARGRRSDTSSLERFSDSINAPVVMVLFLFPGLPGSILVLPAVVTYVV